MLSPLAAPHLWFSLAPFFRAAAQCYGPLGRNALVQRPGGGLLVTRDGATLALEAPLPVGAYRAAGESLKQEVRAYNALCGDATTTYTLLLGGLLGACVKRIVGGDSPVVVARELREWHSGLDLSRWRFDADPELLHELILSSVNGDEECAGVLSEAFMRAGAGGLVKVQDGKGMGWRLRMSDSPQWRVGVAPDGLIPRDCSLSRVEVPLVFVTHDKLQTQEDVVPILEMASTFRSEDVLDPLLILSPGVSREALGVLSYNNRHYNRPLYLWLPLLDRPWREGMSDWVEDLCVASGGRAYHSALGPVTREHFGGLSALEISGGWMTWEINEDACGEAVHQHAQLLQRRADREDSNYNADQMRDRASSLLASRAVVEVCGVTEAETAHMRTRAEDGVHAGQMALTTGLLPGGTMTFCALAQEAPTWLRGGLLYPTRALMGVEGAARCAAHTGAPWEVLDVVRGVFRHVAESPALVVPYGSVEIALERAVSWVSTWVTSSWVVGR